MTNQLTCCSLVSADVAQHLLRSRFVARANVADTRAVVVKVPAADSKMHEKTRLIDFHLNFEKREVVVDVDKPAAPVETSVAAGKGIAVEPDSTVEARKSVRWMIVEEEFVEKVDSV